MSLSNVYSAGLNNVGSYQVSGAPFASGSIDCTTATKVDFPYVTRWVTVTNNGSTPCNIGFSQIGVTNTGPGAMGQNYFVLGKQSAANVPSVTERLELKLSELWISGSDSVSVVAGLTNLPVARVNNIGPSGNNWSGSVGVG
jgi:hypothetical protein